MKQITLIRHAKSSWDHAQLNDHQRPLNARGLNDAPKTGEYILEKHIEIKQFFASDAQRAKQTAELINQKLHYPLEFTNQLYTFNAQAVLKFITQLSDQFDSVAIVGHNPALTELVNQLAGENLTHNLPTAAMVVLQCESNTWQALASLEKTNNVEHFYTPKKVII